MAVHHVLDDYYLAITLLVTLAYQLLGFSIAFTCQFDKLTGKPTLHHNIRRVSFSLPLSLPLRLLQVEAKKSFHTSSKAREGLFFSPSIRPPDHMSIRSTT